MIADCISRTGFHTFSASDTLRMVWCVYYIDIHLTDTTNPYTQGLFGSIPSTTGDAKRLNPIAGLMPDPTNLPRGCKFHTRCCCKVK